MTRDHGPSIKDDARYEELRRHGYSKEKSARIANTPGTRPPPAAARQVITKIRPARSCTSRPSRSALPAARA